MARYTEAKCRLCRQEGVKLFLKGERCYSPRCPIEKKGAVRPGQRSQRPPKRSSEYRDQLREKQKAKRLYGVLERQFKNYYKRAFQVKGQVTGKVLFQLLESRLDNIIYRLRFVSSRSLARQLVSHGHVLVDGKKVNIPSYQVKPEQLISLTSKGLVLDQVKKSLSEKKGKIPDWLKFKAAIGKMVRLPEREEIEADINEHLIVGFYSR